MKNSNKNYALVEQQKYGHDLIDVIESFGYSKDRIYNILDKWLGDKNTAHFGVVENNKSSEKIIKCLELMIKSKKEMKKIPLSYPYFLK